MIENKLKQYRNKIDKTDEKIVELFAERFKVVRKIGEFKKNNNIQIIDSSRFQKVLKKVKSIALQKGISEDFINEIYKIIHKYSCELEK